MSDKCPTGSPKINIGTTRPTGGPEDLLLSVIVPVLNKENGIVSALENIYGAIDRLVVKCDIVIKEYIQILVVVYWFAGEMASLASDTASSDRRLESK